MKMDSGDMFAQAHSSEDFNKAESDMAIHCCTWYFNGNVMVFQPKDFINHFFFYKELELYVYEIIYRTMK